jgi:6-phosphogluconolactonase
VSYNYPQARELTEILINASKEKEGYFYLAISGGRGASVLFSLWRDVYIEAIPWNKIELFWVDERCLPPEDPESNYGKAKRELFGFIPVTKDRIHRIIGENNNEYEAVRYSEEVKKILPESNSLPQFDMILLGVGEDGHTSSIFPGQDDLLCTKRIYAPSVNPYSMQKRVSMTASVILNAVDVLFYMEGESKRGIVERIDQRSKNYLLPVLYIIENKLNCRIFWDK